MKLTEFIQKIMKDFLLIFASIIIILTFLRQIYYPESVFDLKSIYLIMGFAFLSALTEFILYSSHNLSEKKMRIRMVFHFFTLETLLVALAGVLDLVNSTQEALILALQIAGIYFLIRLMSWRRDKKEADQINEKLKAFRKDIYE